MNIVLGTPVAVLVVAVRPAQQLNPRPAEPMLPADAALLGRETPTADENTMFGKRLHLFTVLGFKIDLDRNWIFIAVFVTSAARFA